ncbi:MAG: hypothetical protein WCK13_03170 [Ignavibacteriota bacterium]
MNEQFTLTMNNEKLLNYLNSLDEWMKHFGFEKIEVEESMGVNRLYARNKVSVSKFGMSSTYAGVKYVEQGVDAKWMKQYGENLFKYAYHHRKGMPVGVGASLTVYPLLITESVSFELAAFMKSNAPKHYSSFEFPVVLDFVHDNLYYLQSTPIWGALYYSGFRKEANQLFSVLEWQKISDSAKK